MKTKIPCVLLIVLSLVSGWAQLSLGRPQLYVLRIRKSIINPRNYSTIVILGGKRRGAPF